MTSIPAAVQEKLRHYVYLYIDPRNERVFYVGKGQGNRALAHLVHAPNAAVRETVQRIHKQGLQVRIDILKHGLGPKEAVEVEAAAIDAYGLGTLANRVRGHIGASGGRCRLSDLVRYLEPRKLKAEQPCILIRINQTYRPGMSALELYEATRGIWVLSPEQAAERRYALAVYDGAVLEAYELAHDEAGKSYWFPAGTTVYFTRFQKKSFRFPRDRFEFVGRPVEGVLRRRLIGQIPSSVFPQGSQNPIRYWGVE